MEVGGGSQAASVRKFDKRRCLVSLENTRLKYQKIKAPGTLQARLRIADPNSGRLSAPMESLTVITLPELVVDHVHHGRILYGRLCAKPVVIQSVHTAMEDKFGNAVCLSIHNALWSLVSSEEVEAQFSRGLNMAIKEPYFKLGADGSLYVRVDNPADFVHVANTEGNEVEPEMDEASMVRYLQAIRCAGNRLFRKENWLGAVAKYAECIGEAKRMGKSLKARSESFDNVVMMTFSNRAETQLRLGNYEAAFLDAGNALRLDRTNLKCLARMGQAAMAVGQYESACKVLKIVHKRAPDDASIVESLNLCKALLEQSRAGKYDHNPLVLSRGSLKKYADHFGTVEIRRVSYGGGRRGLFTEEPVKAYAILLVSDAMAVATKEHADDRLITNEGSPEGSGGCVSLARNRNVISQLVHRAMLSVRSLAQLYSLVSAAQNEMEVPSMDLFKPETKWTPPGASALEVDVKLIKEIVRVNSFGTVEVCKNLSKDGNDGQEERLVSGLWILPSFMNHSCVPNCMHRSNESVKLVWAARDIEPDEELTISYSKNLFSGFKARQERARELSFTCECERCVLEKQFEAEVSEISSQVDVLVPRSKAEFSDGRDQNPSTKESDNLADQAEGMIKALNITDPPTGFGEASDGDGKYVATRELADLADRVEALIKSKETRIARHKRGWIRASFLDTYLAKYQLATMTEADAVGRIGMLNVILDSMVSVWTTTATLTMAHLLVQEVKGLHNEETITFKTTKGLVMRVIGSLYAEESNASVWRILLSASPEFDYSTFLFNGEPRGDRTSSMLRADELEME